MGSELEKLREWYRKTQKENIYDMNDIEQNEHMIISLINRIYNWQNMRYPNYILKDIIDLYNGNDIKPRTNIYVNDKPVIVEYQDYLTKDVFLNTLSLKERNLLDSPKYTSVYLEAINDSKFKMFDDAYLYVNRDGIIYLPYNVSDWSNDKVLDEELYNKHLLDAYKLFKERGIRLDKDNNLKKELCKAKKEELLKEKILYCALLKISNNNDNFSKIRAYLFSKDFNLEYDIKEEDKKLFEYIKSYIKGDKIELYQRLVYALNNKGINHETV